MQKCCKVNSTKIQALGTCDFSQYIEVRNNGSIVPRPFKDPIKRQCANLVRDYYRMEMNTTEIIYNTYEDCYMDTHARPSLKVVRQSDLKRRMSLMKLSAFDGQESFIDQGSKLNMGSTDALSGYPCWMDDAKETYINLPEVRYATHIPKNLPHWTDCKFVFFSIEILPFHVNELYKRQYNDTTPFFEQMINSGLDLHILVYNGDTDAVCNFLGAERFASRLATKFNLDKQTRQEWTFAEKPKYKPSIAGYHQRYTTKNGKVIFDFLSVKGSGHFVQLDRPGPALQMLENYIANKNYSSPTTVNTVLKPLLPQYQQNPKPQPTRKERDRVWNLPGITYDLNFEHYSGYLNPSKGNYLHYWFTQSQNDPANDPLLLWLNGGPGCSSLTGLLTELGPFWLNPDGRTLMENIYSWNRVANVLFLESPRQVGYSYQDTKENNDTMFNDEKVNVTITSIALTTATDNFLAIMDFLSVFPEFYNRPFYVSGESYAGVYIPTLVSLIIQMIQAGKAPGLNLAGVAIGNGKMSDKYQLNSVISLFYNHGMYGVE
ncbi:unnamed protein product [Anisakis simplex]|uniref:Carboxypeptidase n=1 Tax=Anisakis simplex TaxID=6269 RepID=A0A3P6N7Y7_ANISI|nr:unnamed protein product [Anisakis simplex]